MSKILSERFFNRPAEKVAKELLGKFLVREYRHRSARNQHKSARSVAVMITEVEAYVGPQDKASHASHGRTARNEPMWGEAGNFYVYFTYGMHWMLNVVTGKKGCPAAVLIRGGLTNHSLSLRAQRSNPARLPRSPRLKRRGSLAMTTYINGPARLTKFLKIDKKFNGVPANKKTGLWLEDRGIKITCPQIKRGPRVGVDYAGRWAKKPYNFKLEPISKPIPSRV